MMRRKRRGDSVLLRDLLQRVPLGDGSARVGQHVAPVTQLRAGGVAAQHDAANGLRRADAVVVHARDDQRHFLSDKGAQIQHYYQCSVRYVTAHVWQFGSVTATDVSDLTLHMYDSLAVLPLLMSQT